MTKSTDVVDPIMVNKKEKDRAHLLLVALLGTLLVTMAIYLSMHLVIPSGGPLLADTKARDDALAAVAQARELLTDRVTAQDVQGAFGDLRAEVGSTLGEELSDEDAKNLDELFAKASEDLLKVGTTQQKTAVKGFVEGLKEAVGVMYWVNTKGVIDPSIDIIDQELNRDEPDWARVRQLLERIREEAQRNGDRGFWQAGGWRWVELAFWCIFGTLIFLLAEIRRWYPRIGDAGCSFIEFTPWYVINLVRGPIIAILILVFLTSVQGEILGVKISFTEAPFTLLVFLAGVLGYFSREARDQLEILVERVFPEAWNRARGGLNILPDTLTLALGETTAFTVEPDQDVVWSHHPAEMGEMSADGTFTATKEEKFADQSVTILAEWARNRKKYATARVTLTSSGLRIKPPNPEVQFGQEQQFTVEPGVPVTWSVEKDVGEISESGLYTAPKKGELEEAQPGKAVIIKAVRRDVKTVSATTTVTFKE